MQCSLSLGFGRMFYASVPLCQKQEEPQGRSPYGQNLLERQKALFHGNGRAQHRPHHPHDAHVDADHAQQAAKNSAQLLAVAHCRLK